MKPGKGAAFVRTKLKNQLSGAPREQPTASPSLAVAYSLPAGNTVEKTFRAGEKARCPGPPLRPALR